jgi:hypothetical protein
MSIALHFVECVVCVCVCVCVPEVESEAVHISYSTPGFR